MIFWPRKKKDPAPDVPKRRSFFSTHAVDAEDTQSLFPAWDEWLDGIVRSLPGASALGNAMDDSSNGVLSTKLINAEPSSISDALINWYASQSFIGHQLCGILAQHWLINKACTMPGRDAIRNGYRAVSVDGDDLDDKTVKMINRYDRKYKLNWHLEQFIRKGRIFGVRIAFFKVESTDLEYYQKPFNIDGVTPNSYKGIVQVDPYWCAPFLEGIDASKPDGLHFYDPTFWIINGQKYHRSHLIIFRNAEPIDILKPMYLYGGIPVPQMIMERVYAAERTANEAPQLAQTKRTNVWLSNMEQIMADPEKTAANFNAWAYYRDNFAVKLGDKEGDEFQQFDTSLTDLDEVIMTQYQIVAAAAGVPATKLLGTQPKGFNSTGDYEESSYHEELESIQTHDLTPMIERHHMLVMKSFVNPKGKGDAVETTVSWMPLDAPTADELADTNLKKAQTGNQLVMSGAIAPEEERQRIALDKDSGYHELGLSDEAPDDIDDEEGNDPEDDKGRRPESKRGDRE